MTLAIIKQMPGVLGLLLMLACQACDQAHKEKATVLPGAGPGGIAVNMALAEPILAPFTFRCEFHVVARKSITLYHLVSNRWTTGAACNNAAGYEVWGHISDKDGDRHWMVTGWYESGKNWIQCDWRGWKPNESGRYLSCPAPDGGSLSFICLQGDCSQ